MIEKDFLSYNEELYPKRTVIFSIKKIKNQKKWSKEEDRLLLKLAEKYNEKHWKEISKRFQNKNALQCFSRYKRIKPGIIKGSWKKEEDQKILELIRKYGKSWSKIAKVISTRNGKQIRDRFINVLDPNIKKGKFTFDEDHKLIELFHKHGPKWATIAKYFPFRTADMIKNRFHSSIKKTIFESNYKQIINSVSRRDSLAETKSSLDAGSHEDSIEPALSANESDLILRDHTPRDIYYISCMSPKDEINEMYPFNMLMTDKEDSYNSGTLIWNFDEYFSM